MSTELFLELGDIIEINAPSNSIINNNRYFIDYIDQKIINLIHDTTLEKISFDIDDKGKLSDETIESIAILNRSDEKGYARQNNLSINQWISIYIGGDMPSVITGQITNLEEDMIEVTTWPKNEKIYIDFAYQGIPLNIPFEKFILRGPPGKTTLIDGKENISLQQGEQGELVSPGEQGQQDEQGQQETEDEVAIRIKEFLINPEDIEFGEELDEITQIITVPEEERRYDIQTQKNAILDDLLSTVPVTNRTKTVLNDIHKMIERFIQLREEFSSFNESGVTISEKKINIKPLIKYLQRLEKGIPQWILPIVKNKKKIYDLHGLEDEEQFQDVKTKKFKAEIDELINKFPYLRKKEERSKEETQPSDGRNQYDYLMTELASFFKPDERTDIRNDVIIEQETNTNLDVVINNYDDFSSSNAWSWETENSFTNKEYMETSRIRTNQFCIQRYNTGQNRIQIEKLENFKIKTSFLKITRNDRLDICGYIFFPNSVINYSRIKNPKTNIKTRVQLNMTYFGYNSILSSIKNKMVNLNISDTEKNEDFKIKDVTVLTLDPENDEENKHEQFLNAILPNTDQLLEVLNVENKVSFTKILYMLEPFLIYDHNINYNIYKKIHKIIKQEVILKRKKIVEKKAENDKYLKYDYKTNIERNLLLKDYADLSEIYGIENKTNSEIFRHMFTLDNAQTFMTYMSLKDLDLHSGVDIEQIAEQGLEEVDKKEETPENPCENYVLTKEYFDIQQLTLDDGKDEIFFDKKYDITHYEILEEFKLERTTLEQEEFRDFLFNHLKKNVGMNEKDAFEETTAILTGKRIVREGQYSVIKDHSTGNILYYKRVGTQWILDEDIKDKEMGDVFCNLRNKCLKINKKCLDNNLSKSQFNKKLLKQMMEHFNKEFYLSKEELSAKLQEDLKENILSIKKLTRLKILKQLKYDRYKLQLGRGLEESEELLKSPYEELRDNILGQSNFVKKQNDVILFTEKYCQKKETDRYWYYCIDTNIPLLPTFYKELADAYKYKNYIKKLDEITRDRGTLSDDGGYIVDKYSGYLIRAIDFDISEGYEESGYKKVSREQMSEDLGEIMARQIIPKKEDEAEDVKKIKNVIIKLSEHMGISLEKDHIFIINNIANSMETDPAIAKEEKKHKGKGKQLIRDMFLFFYTLAYLLISIQTIIPPPRSKKSFPGCDESFLGFPFNEDDTDYRSIKYLSCIVNKIKANVGIWKVVNRFNEAKIQKNLLKMIKEKVIKIDNIKLRLKTRREYVPERELIPTEINVKNWITFLPPLQNLKVKKVRNLGDGFKASLNNNIKGGDIEQFSQILEIQSKLFYFSLNIQESIQEIIHQETPLLTNMENIPFLENSCCNEGETNVLQYFIEKDKSIGIHNGQVYKLSQLYNSYKKLSKAKILYDRTDTKLPYPEIEKQFSSETIYKAFIHYCNFNKGGLPDDLAALCISSESDIMDDDTFDEKVKKLKDEGKNFNREHLTELLNIIAKQNIIKGSIKEDDVLHPHQFLIELLEYFLSIDTPHVSLNLINLLKSLTDSFDVLDWSKDGPEYKTVMTLQNFLILSNNELRIKILKFLKENSSVKKKGKGSMENIEFFLETIKEWKPRGDNIFMDVDDETSYFVLDFFKQAIKDIAIIYPSIIINEVEHEKVGIPKHWGVSDKHLKLLQRHIEEEFKKSNYNINFPSFYGGNLKNLLEKIKKNTRNLLLLMERTPFFSKINGVDTIFDSSLVKDMGEFYFLTILNSYIDLQDDIIETKKSGEEEHHSTDSVISKNFGTETLLEIVDGEKEDSQKTISNLLVCYLNIFILRKEDLNYNKDTIDEIILSAKIKETKKITQRYKELPDEIRKVKKIHQNLKLKEWGIGQTKAVHQYDPNQFDKELGAILAQSIIEKGGEGEDEVTMRLRGILSDEDIQEMDMEARQQAETAIQMSLLGDDDDHGERDGDEGF